LAALAAISLGAEPGWAAPIEAKALLCASCHGGHGLPSDPKVPIIWGQQAAYIKKELGDYRAGDRESQIMSSIAESLSEEEIAQIATDFGDAKWPEQLAVLLPAAPAATEVCKTCHNADLTGGTSPSGIAPRLAGQNSAYLVDTIAAYATGERANSTVMGPLMQSLSPADRKTIAEYLAALR